MAIIKINKDELDAGFNAGYDTVRFSIGNYYFLVTLSKERLDDIVNNGYEKADVIKVEPVKKDETADS